jgi:hypothetical protein
LTNPSEQKSIFGPNFVSKESMYQRLDRGDIIKAKSVSIERSPGQWEEIGFLENRYQ